MAKHYGKQFKLDAVQYYHDHKNLGLQGCATNLGISQQTLSLSLIHIFPAYAYEVAKRLAL